ncbi:O-antigen ligase family protein [Brevibacillus migulae]|uniref:O-antigen ligase family protein n=1 Tax=Brevibacillus migulae TaxID=1644114 RepID=UPI00106ED789|nr:O-antigen ligase [Brevibacillus migulae]
MAISIESSEIQEKRWKVDFLLLGRKVEKCVILASLLLFSGGIMQLLTQQSGTVIDPTEGNPLMQACWFGIYAVSFFLILLRWKRVLQVMKRDKWLVLLLFFTTCSLFWSYAPEVTLRRIVALFGTTAFGIYLAARYSMKEQLRLVAFMLGAAIVLSVIFAWVLPGYGIYSEDRGEAWRGIFVHKNILGRLMALSSLVFLLLCMAQRQRRSLYAGFLGLSLCLLILSNSKTALIIFLFQLIVFTMMPMLRMKNKLLAVFLGIVLILAGSLTFLAVDIGTVAEASLESMDRDVTLTGRTDLWMALFDRVKEHPYLGYGYSGFWLGNAGESYQILLDTGWMPVHSHNGLLDILIDLGVVGLILFFVTFSAGMARGVRLIQTTRSIESYWPLLCFTFLFLYMFPEDSLFKQNNVFWILFVSTTLRVAGKRSGSSG